MTAMHLVGMPTDPVSAEAMHRILGGGATKVAEAGCNRVGGHSIRSAEPIYGLSVTGMVRIEHILSNAGAVAERLRRELQRAAA